MDVIEFQKKLEEVCALAEKNGKILTGEQVRACFGEMELDRGQLLKILQYMKSKGIRIEGVPQEGTEPVPEEKNTAGTRVPLNPEEKAYLEEYKRDLAEGIAKAGEDERKAFVQALERGDANAKGRLAGLYMPLAADLAAEMNCEEIPLADLIQEANICLLMALDEMECWDEKWLESRIRQGINVVVEEQSRRRQGDDSLVEKVEKLESAVRELSDDEDEEIKFSINELAIILDMEVDEIRDILRLTGDDK